MNAYIWRGVTPGAYIDNGFIVLTGSSLEEARALVREFVEKYRDVAYDGNSGEGALEPDCIVVVCAGDHLSLPSSQNNDYDRILSEDPDMVQPLDKPVALAYSSGYEG